MSPTRALFSLVILVATMVLATGAAHIQRRAISQSLMDDFTRYIKFAVGADQPVCPSPVGTTLVTAVSQAV